MAGDQYPPYPGQYTYEQFGTGPPYLGGPAPGKATLPKTVTYAVYSILA